MQPTGLVVLGVTMRRIADVLSRFGVSLKVVSAAALSVHASLLVGCSSLSNPSTSAGSWLASGSLALSRPVPPIFTTKGGRASAALPTTATSEIAQIIISRQDRTITAMQPGSAPMVFKTEGAQLLPMGSFSVTLKEDKPLWYAPNEYFTKRSLEVPDQGSRSRFMRAALGHRALYLNDQTPIHSGPVWLQEIGGVRVKQREMDQLYSMVNVGTRVEVR
jgi:hypothetical protein